MRMSRRLCSYIKPIPKTQNWGVWSVSRTSTGGYWADGGYGYTTTITNILIQEPRRMSGYTDYDWVNPSTGTFARLGWYVTVGYRADLSGFDAGTVWVWSNNDRTITRYTYYKTADGSFRCEISSKSSYYVEGTGEVYSLGAFDGTIVEAFESTTPVIEIAKYGFYYVTTISSGGSDYLVYTSGNGNYWGYKKA